MFSVLFKLLFKDSGPHISHTLITYNICHLSILPILSLIPFIRTLFGFTLWPVRLCPTYHPSPTPLTPWLNKWGSLFSVPHFWWTASGCFRYSPWEMWGQRPPTPSLIHSFLPLPVYASQKLGIVRYHMSMNGPLRASAMQQVLILLTRHVVFQKEVKLISHTLTMTLVIHPPICNNAILQAVSPTYLHAFLPGFRHITGEEIWQVRSRSLLIVSQHRSHTGWKCLVSSEEQCLLILLLKMKTD